MKIKPFKALRPPKDKAEQVASVPYDTVNSDEARLLAEGNALSFLHIVRPEIDLPADVDLHAYEVYQQAADNFVGFQEDGTLVREDSDCLYIYRQKMGEHVQRGVVACSAVADYENNLIKKHEKTRQDKEDDRTKHVLTLDANAGPVFLTYKDNALIDDIVAEVEAGEPLYDFTAPDGIEHAVWKIEDVGSLVQAFRDVPMFYIADGHHRAAAAGRAGREKKGANPDHKGDEEYNWFLTVLFPAGQLKILPYNRCVVDLNGQTPEKLMSDIEEVFNVTSDANPVPECPRSVSMYLEGRWYGLSWDKVASDDPVADLDVSVLQDRLLAPMLGIDDPRTSIRVDFIGGIRGTEDLERRVDSGESMVAFSMYPVLVEQMMAIADADEIMPPKSTWFEPKLRSGLLVHTL